MDREAWWAAVHGLTELDVTEHSCIHTLTIVTVLCFLRSFGPDKEWLKIFLLITFSPLISEAYLMLRYQKTPLNSNQSVFFLFHLLEQNLIYRLRWFLLPLFLKFLEKSWWHISWLMRSSLVFWSIMFHLHFNAKPYCVSIDIAPLTRELLFFYFYFYFILLYSTVLGATLLYSTVGSYS